MSEDLLGRILAAVETLLSGQESLRASQESLRAEQARLRGDMMARMDRLQASLDQMREAVAVDLHSEARVQRKLFENASDNQFLLEQVVRLQQQILTLTGRVEAVEARH
jgi:hypothetical protein